jgi:hypothetical protein
MAADDGQRLAPQHHSVARESGALRRDPVRHRSADDLRDEGRATPSRRGATRRKRGGKRTILSSWALMSASDFLRSAASFSISRWRTNMASCDFSRALEKGESQEGVRRRSWKEVELAARATPAGTRDPIAAFRRPGEIPALPDAKEGGTKTHSKVEDEAVAPAFSPDDMKRAARGCSNTRAEEMGRRRAEEGRSA